MDLPPPEPSGLPDGSRDRPDDLCTRRQIAVRLSITVQIWIIGAFVPLAFVIHNPFGRVDFGVFWVAGKMALSGTAGYVYDPVIASNFAASLGVGGSVIFPYPPHALILFAPFATLPPVPAYFVWNGATAALFYWASRTFLPRNFPGVLVILTPAALINMDFGQTGLLLGALWLIAFRGMWPGVGLLTFKPHLGALAVLALRDWRAFFKTSLLAAGLILLTLLLFSPSVWVDFLKHSLGHAAEIGERKRWLFAGVAPAIGYGLWGWIPFATAAALILVRNVNVFTAATASFLISPYGFHYDMTVVCLGFGLLIFCSWQEMPVQHRIPLALGFMAPIIALAGAWWVPPVLLWALWVQTKYEAPLGRDGVGRQTVIKSGACG